MKFFKKITLVFTCAALIVTPVAAKETVAKSDSTLKKVFMVGAGTGSVVLGFGCMVLLGIGAPLGENINDSSDFKTLVGVLACTIGAIYCGAKVALPVVKEACVHAKKLYNSCVKKTTLKDEHKACHSMSD